MRSVRHILRRAAGPALAGAFGFGWFVYQAGWEVLDPTQLTWLLNGEDWGQHLFGWLFFRNEPWALPLGRVEGYVHPIGTTVGFTDSVPWVAILLKPLSPLLPVAFQYIGPWMALSFAAVGVAGALVVRAHAPSAWLEAFGGALFAATPVLLARLGHEALLAQWLIVLVVGGLLRAALDAATARGSVRTALLLVVLAVGVHPYLAAMVLLLAIALVWRFALVDRVERVPAAVGGTLVLCAAAVAVLALLGFLGGPPAAATTGFGWFNADLLALVNARGMSRWMPEIRASRPHLEGFGFPGIGAWALTMFAVGSIGVRWNVARTLPWKRGIPLAAVAAIAFVFALANDVGVAGETWVRLDGLYRATEGIASTFRATGRFVWIAHWALLATAVILASRLWRGTIVAHIALPLALGLQLADLPRADRRIFQRPPIDVGLRSSLWETLGAEHRHLALVPPQISYAQAACEGEFDGGARVPFGYLAYRQKMTINGGNLARMDLQAVRRSCAELRDRFRGGDLDPQTVYVPGPESLRALLLRGPRSAVCGRVDGWPVCVSAMRDTKLLRALLENPL